MWFGTLSQTLKGLLQCSAINLSPNIHFGRFILKWRAIFSLDLPCLPGVQIKVILGLLLSLLLR
jgi:hypothetical protein